MQIENSKNRSSAFVLIKTRGGEAEFEAELANVQGVSRAYLLAGDHGYLAELNTPNNDELGRSVREIKGLDGVDSLQTFVVLDTLAPNNSDIASLKSSQADEGGRTPYQRFLDQLIALGMDRSSLHGYMRVYRRPYTGARSSLVGAKFFYYIATRWSRVELYVDRLDSEENKRIFDTLLARKNGVEETFGDELNWERLDHRRACRISFRLPGGYNDPETLWGEVQEKLIDSMVRLQQSLEPHLRELS